MPEAALRVPNRRFGAPHSRDSETLRENDGFTLRFQGR